MMVTCIPSQLGLPKIGMWVSCILQNLPLLPIAYANYHPLEVNVLWFFLHNNVELLGWLRSHGDFDNTSLPFYLLFISSPPLMDMNSLRYDSKQLSNKTWSFKTDPYLIRTRLCIWIKSASGFLCLPVTQGHIWNVWGLQSGSSYSGSSVHRGIVMGVYKIG